MTVKYGVYWEGDLQAEFDTRREAQDYVKRDVKGMAEAYGHTQKWVRERFRWTIERIEYN